MSDESETKAADVATGQAGQAGSTSSAQAVSSRPSAVASSGSAASKAPPANSAKASATKADTAKAETPVYLSSSPHFTQGLSTQRIMLTVLVALLPECVFGVLYFGPHALAVIVTCVASCAVFEYLFQRITGQKVVVSNLSCCVSGVMLALVLPSTTPIWMAVLGSFVAMVVAKGLFGGIGSNVFNPALTGRAFMFISFPAALGATWFDPAVDAVSSATVLSSIKAGTFVASPDVYLQFFLGSKAGCIGEVSALLIVLSFVYLLFVQVIDWRAPLAMVATVAVCTLVTGGDVLLSLLTGGLLFGAVFMVTDYATAPVTKPGRLVFGAGCGLVTFLIRKWGGYPEGVMFSILIMNAIVPFLNNLTSRMYGYGKRGSKEAIK